MSPAPASRSPNSIGFSGGRAPALVANAEVTTNLPDLLACSKATIKHREPNLFRGIKLELPASDSRLLINTDDKIDDIARGRRPPSRSADTARMAERAAWPNRSPAPGRWVESSIHPDRYWSFRMLINKVWRLPTILVGAALSAGCVPQHYSVGVARGPTHITYAQRHHDAHQTDYLVGCELGADGEPTDECSVVKLEAE